MHLVWIFERYIDYILYEQNHVRAIYTLYVYTSIFHINLWLYIDSFREILFFPLYSLTILIPRVTVGMFEKS